MVGIFCLYFFFIDYYWKLSIGFQFYFSIYNVVFFLVFLILVLFFCESYIRLKNNYII